MSTVAICALVTLAIVIGFHGVGGIYYRAGYHDGLRDGLSGAVKYYEKREQQETNE